MNRRGFLTGVIGLLAAPAIVRVASLMPISVIEQPLMFAGVPIEWDELAAITRKAFVPRRTVQLYYATPTLSLLIKNQESAI